MRLSLVPALLLFSTGLAGLAGAADFVHPIPADKNFSPAWVASLTARGGPEVCRGDSLKFIGMPVGGLCAGLVYLGGDGETLIRWTQPVGLTAGESLVVTLG